MFWKQTWSKSDVKDVAASGYSNGFSPYTLKNFFRAKRMSEDHINLIFFYFNFWNDAIQGGRRRALRKSYDLHSRVATTLDGLTSDNSSRNGQRTHPKKHVCPMQSMDFNPGRDWIC